MVKTYKILNNNVYFSNNEQNIVTSDELIDEFLSGMDENEDADLIGWMLTNKKNGTSLSIDECITFISSAWELDIKEIDNVLN